MTCSPTSSNSKRTARRNRRVGLHPWPFPPITGSQHDCKNPRATATRLRRPGLAVLWLPAILSLRSIYAGLAILAWLPVFYGELSVHSAFAPRDWHVHEMLYGYLPAVITGFLFTAIPNWTGQLPIQGTPLVALF